MCSFACHVVKRNRRTLLLFPISQSLRQDLPVLYKQFSLVREMPRSIEQMLNMQKQRQRLKDKSTKYMGNTTVSLQVGIAPNDSMVVIQH